MLSGAQAAARQALEDSGLVVLLSERGTSPNVLAAMDWLAGVLVAAVQPVIQAEVLADLSDEFAHEFPGLALALDEASHQIRETITR